MHRSKIGLAQWLAAIWSWDIRPPVLARELGISAPASRRISAALEMTEQPPGEGRLAVLLTQHHDLTEAMRARLPATLKPEDNPVADLTSGQRAVMGVLRNRINGTTAEQIAEKASLTVEHTLTCLDALFERGYARCEDTSVPWGYGSLTLPLWSLNLTEECITALAFLPWRVEPTSRSMSQSLASRVVVAVLVGLSCWRPKAPRGLLGNSLHALGLPRSHRTCVGTTALAR